MQVALLPPSHLLKDACLQAHLNKKYNDLMGLVHVFRDQFAYPAAIRQLYLNAMFGFAFIGGMLHVIPQYMRDPTPTSQKVTRDKYDWAITMLTQHMDITPYKMNISDVDKIFTSLPDTPRGVGNKVVHSISRAFMAEAVLASHPDVREGHERVFHFSYRMTAQEALQHPDSAQTTTSYWQQLYQQQQQQQKQKQKQQKQHQHKKHHHKQQHKQ
jgi:hypothetical protein